MTYVLWRKLGQRTGRESEDWHLKQGGQRKPFLKTTCIAEERLLSVGEEQVHRPQAGTEAEYWRNGYGQCDWVGVSL